jgi:hypothetical protein
VTGKVTVNVNQGGVRTDVITEQNARIRLGSELDDLTDAAFFPEIVVDKESEVG